MSRTSGNWRFAILSLTNTVLAYSFTLPFMLAIDPWLAGAVVFIR